MRDRKTLLVGLMLTSALCAPALAQTEAAPGTARNVIMLISDGAGMETWDAASYYEHGVLGRQTYDTWPVKLFSSTIPLNTEREPTMTEEPAVTLDIEELWSDAPSDVVFEGGLGNYEGLFAGYSYTRVDVTDSAAAGTALATGHKTYNNAINWSNMDQRLTHIGELAVESGRALGVVSSVQWTHATPAAYLAHHRSRNENAEMANQIIDEELATIVIGAGHPYFDANGDEVESPEDEAFRFVGGRETWERLTGGETGYRHIEENGDFEALANGELELAEGEKIIGTFRSPSTLQFGRDGVAGGDLNDLPNLSTLALGALEVLNRDEDGFFLMVEGGAVDWAAHANNLPRLIEEQMDFNQMVTAVSAWVEENSSWDETLVIVTTDHGNGLLQGPDSNTSAYSRIVSQGAGAMPLVRWHSDTHTRELVPVFANGPGAEYFLEVAQPDPGLAAYGVSEESQVYVDNTDIFRASAAAMGLAAE